MSAILMIDDDVELCQLVAEYLALDGLSFHAEHTGPNGLAEAKTDQYQLILLDVMLPGMDGLSVLKELRKENYCPVLMLTARGDDVDRIVGLELGADDYLAKPFNPRELVARIKAILRRVELMQAPTNTNSVLEVNGLMLNLHNREVQCHEQLLNLTVTEFQLLEILMQQPGIVHTKDELSKKVLGKRLQMYDRSLDMHISNLRKKIGQYSPVEKIKTLRGAGYLLLPAE